MLIYLSKHQINTKTHHNNDSPLFGSKLVIIYGKNSSVVHSKRAALNDHRCSVIDSYYNITITELKSPLQQKVIMSGFAFFSRGCLSLIHLFRSVVKQQRQLHLCWRTKLVSSVFAIEDIIIIIFITYKHHS